MLSFSEFVEILVMASLIRGFLVEYCEARRTRRCSKGKPDRLERFGTRRRLV